jgi:protocatechuate 3,4-dioxygenase beta subunit
MTTAEPLADVNPPYLSPGYQVSVLRSPTRRLLDLPRGWFHELPGPAFGQVPVDPGDNDLTAGHRGPPAGQRIILSGRVLDSDGRGVPNALIEIWQANASGRYVDRADPALMPLDPNFTGAGRCLTDNDGRYRFITVRPAAYAGPTGTLFRPAHIHFSLFGITLSQRLITQCYFEGDPLIERDPIARAIPDPAARGRLIARFDPVATPSFSGGEDSSLCYTWDVVLRGPVSTPMVG